MPKKRNIQQKEPLGIDRPPGISPVIHSSPEYAVRNVLIDGREFVQGRKTGIGRVLEGLVDSLAVTHFAGKIFLAVQNAGSVPLKLKGFENIHLEIIPRSFLASEKALSNLTEKADLHISPYPKLPIFGCHCPCIHTIHDVLDLTHPVYKKRFKVFFDTYRLKKALNKANLTWYDSSWSMQETKRLVRFAGRSPRVRFPGISDRFRSSKNGPEDQVISKYGLDSGYILVIGNGLPHKNLGVLLSISDQISGKLVFAGVAQKNQSLWNKQYPNAKAKWIEYVDDEHLPALISGAFCLAQPSTAEGYGYPPLEAMACGVPAVVSDIPVLNETTEGNALVATTSDAQSWIDAFRALENKNLYRDQVNKGLQWVKPLLGRKGWNKHLADIKELL